MPSRKTYRQLADLYDFSVAVDTTWCRLHKSQYVLEAAAQHAWERPEDLEYALKTLRGHVAIAICKRLIYEWLRNPAKSMSLEALRKKCGLSSHRSPIETTCKTLVKLGLIHDHQSHKHATHEYCATKALMQAYRYDIAPRLEALRDGNADYREDD